MKRSFPAFRRVSASSAVNVVVVCPMSLSVRPVPGYNPFSRLLIVTNFNAPDSVGNRSMRPTVTISVLIALAGGVAACGGNDKSAAPAAAAPASTAAAPAKPAAPPDEDLPPSELETSLPPAVREQLLKKSTGDFDEMIQRRLVRIGLTPSRTFYFVDKGVQRGVAYDYGLLMEDRINAKLGNKNIKVHVLFVPMPRVKL